MYISGVVKVEVINLKGSSNYVSETIISSMIFLFLFSKVCVCVYLCHCVMVTYPEVGGCKSGWSRDIGGGGGVGVEGIDVGQQGAHHCWHP